MENRKLNKMNLPNANLYTMKIYTFSLMIILLTANRMPAQFMTVTDSYGEKVYERISEIDKITFGIPPAYSTCGDVFSTNESGTMVYYETVQIGPQCWFKKNLNVGTMIEYTTDGIRQTDNDTIEKYCYNNDPANCEIYGGLYEWNEAIKYVLFEIPRGICPLGWHIPNFAELQILINNLEVAVNLNSLKAIGQGSGTNETGFEALLGGYQFTNGNFFDHIDSQAYFWSSTENGSDLATSMILYGESSVVTFSEDGFKTSGFSVRCIK